MTTRSGRDSASCKRRPDTPIAFDGDWIRLLFNDGKYGPAAPAAKCCPPLAKASLQILAATNGHGE